MDRERKEGFNILRDSLLQAIVQSKDRAQLGRANEAKMKTINEELQKYVAMRNKLVEATNYARDVYKDIQGYADERKAKSIESLKLAVKKAGQIVVDADTYGIRLSIKEKKAKVVDETGADINLCEGSGFRSTMGVLIKYTVIREQPDCCQFIFLDEAVNTLDSDSLTNLREYLNYFKDDMLIVGIEQSDLIFSGLDKTVYEVDKKGKVSTVRKVST